MYPIKFKPILKEKVWGGKRLLDIKKGSLSHADTSKDYGESWDLSGLEGNVSVAANGFLKGNNLQEIIEVYMGDLVGEAVFDRYGLDFPLLVKTIDCHDRLSVQVHPNDDIAAERHGKCGKSEMWYVVDAAPDAAIYIGFKDRNITREQYIDAVAKGNVAGIIQPVKVKAGDVFYIPAGTVHTMTQGVSVIEIQQPVDLTYRIFDWNRVDDKGRSRELHTAWAVDAIDFESTAESCRRNYTAETNKATEVVNCDYFTANIIKLSGTAERDYCKLDSFVIYVCADGKAEIDNGESLTPITAGETVLIPAETGDVTLKGEATILECYIA